MADYTLSRLALSDLKAIARYTLENWGRSQSEQYLNSLQHSFTLLAAKPNLGRPCDEIRKGYRRIESSRHVIFCRLVQSASSPHKQQVQIVRLLHQRMLPLRHFKNE